MNTRTEDPSPLIDLVLRPVRSQMTFESCVEQLGSAIQLGILRPGDRLPSERDLAARLDVSRATLREAISALRAAGLVSTSRGRGGGTVVTSRPNPAAPDALSRAELEAELTDVIVLRSVVEPGAAAAGASRDLSAPERELLLQSLADVEQANEPADYRQADARLHLAIAAASGSPTLAASCGETLIRVHRLLARIPFLQPNIHHSDEQHRGVVQAILDRDPDAASAVMREHCDATAALLRGLVT